MGVALGAQHFAVDGGTGGSLLSSFFRILCGKHWPLLQGAFGSSESPLHRAASAT